MEFCQSVAILVEQVQWPHDWGGVWFIRASMKMTPKVIFYTLRDKKKVSCEEKRPVDSNSREPIKQPYVGRFSRSIRRDQFSIPKIWDSCYFCRIFSFVMILMKILETSRFDWYNWEEHLEFFSEFSVRTFPEERVFLLKKRGFDTFQVVNLLGHGIQILTTRSKGPSEKNTSLFYQNFPSISFSRNNF